MMMMNKKYFLQIVFVVCGMLNMQAQSIIENGIIKFEKKVNLHKQMEGWSDTWSEAMKKNMPKYQVSNFELQFTTTSSIYKKSKEQPLADPRMRNSWMRDEEEKNVVYKNIESQQIISQKQVFEKILLLKDTLPKINWKITNEFKKIADKNCRKATAIIMDSIYIIAFYADDIICSSGPESLNGLPGMILGAVVPRLNVSYFAVSITPYTAPNLDEVPNKGTAYNYKQLIEKLDKSLDDWGKKWKMKTMWSLLL
jgi:GLPGLI family protein